MEKAAFEKLASTIQKRKTEGFVAALTAAGRSEDQIKKAHAIYKSADAKRQQQIETRRRALRSTLLAK